MEIECTIASIIYRNDSTGFSILSCNQILQGCFYGRVVIKGVMAVATKNLHIICEGDWIEDKKYGKQFAFSTYREVLPTTLDGIEAYLSSGFISGIGPTLAKRIVRHFGTNTLVIIDKHPERLNEVNGIGKEKIARIRKSWNEQKAIADIMVFFKGHDITTGTAMKIIKRYGDNCIEKIKEHPYWLCRDIRGIGFRTADEIALSLGIAEDSEERIEAGIEHTLQEAVVSGHCYLPKKRLSEMSAKILNVDKSFTAYTIDQMVLQEQIMEDGDEAVYLKSLYNDETCVAAMINYLLSASGMKINVDKAIERMQKNTGISYDAIQLEAIETAITSKFMILTGGPGTGKSTTLKGIIEAFRTNHSAILLAAPTGRAAKRMTEATGMPAKTIHRLLEYNQNGGFTRNSANPLSGDVLIVDESSMIDVSLMCSLLEAVPRSMTVILVGDVDQLPSVGPGNVLKDIIASGVVPVVKLTRIFRQAQGSKIILNSHRINEGEDLDLSGGKDADFFFIRQDDDKDIADTIINLCKDRLPQHYGYDPMHDIQVLTPMKKSSIGVQAMNEKLQEMLNPYGAEIKHGNGEFRIGDKVMQVVNNYDKDVFNGDIGYIDDIDLEDKTLSVAFDGGKVVEYENSDFSELQLAYACTIHKSQGSEYPVVVMPVSMAHYIMLQRNLLYTGVTRARKLMILVGDGKAIRRAIRNNQIAKRYTLLAERLKVCSEKSA